MFKIEELIDILKDINENICSLNSKLDDIKGIGLYNNISDVCDKLDDVNEKLDDIKGIGLYNSISDVCDKLNSLETTIELK